MRRPLILSLLLLAACRNAAPEGNQAEAEPAAPRPQAFVSYAGSGRDRLCIGGPNADAGVVAYGEGDSNCLVRGRIENGALIPNGDQGCRLPVSEDGDRMTFGPLPESCAYYCGPGASLAGKTFTRMEKPEPASDLAGDPLC